MKRRYDTFYKNYMFYIYFKRSVKSQHHNRWIIDETPLKWFVWFILVINKHKYLICTHTSVHRVSEYERRGGGGTKEFFPTFQLLSVLYECPTGSYPLRFPNSFSALPLLYSLQSREQVYEINLYTTYIILVLSSQINCLKRCLSMIQALYGILAIFFL